MTNEFYKLGDVERTLGMPISPLCDRRKDTDVAKNQLGFLRFVCRPFYAAVAMELPSHSKALERLDANLAGTREAVARTVFANTYLDVTLAYSERSARRRRPQC